VGLAVFGPGLRLGCAACGRVAPVPDPAAYGISRAALRRVLGALRRRLDFERDDVNSDVTRVRSEPEMVGG